MDLFPLILLVGLLNVLVYGLVLLTYKHALGQWYFGEKKSKMQTFFPERKKK